jgi:hypothetical protein
MRQWEYCIVQYLFPDTHRAREGKVIIQRKDDTKEQNANEEFNFIELITKLGAEGWEIASSTSHQGYLHFIFARLKPTIFSLYDQLGRHELTSEIKLEIIERMSELQEKILESYFGPVNSEG